MSNGKPDTDSQDWQLDCLARHILNMASKPDRLAFLDRMHKKLASKAGEGAAAAADLFIKDVKRRILEQHELRKAARLSGEQKS